MAGNTLRAQIMFHQQWPVVSGQLKAKAFESSR
jgi:hypothetical protein